MSVILCVLCAYVTLFYLCVSITTCFCYPLLHLCMSRYSLLTCVSVTLCFPCVCITPTPVSHQVFVTHVSQLWADTSASLLLSVVHVSLLLCVISLTLLLSFTHVPLLSYVIHASLSLAVDHVSVTLVSLLLCVMFLFKYDLEVLRTPSSNWQGFGTWPPDHDSVFHVPWTPILTTEPSQTVHLCYSMLFQCVGFFLLHLCLCCSLKLFLRYSVLLLYLCYSCVLSIAHLLKSNLLPHFTLCKLWPWEKNKPITAVFSWSYVTIWLI